MNELLLLTGIPGAGKTTYGAAFADRFGFAHYNLEEAANLSRFGGRVAHPMSSTKMRVVGAPLFEELVLWSKGWD